MSNNYYRKFSNKKNPTGYNIKPPYIVYNPHEGNAPLDDPEEKDKITITTIDPGRINCGIYIGNYYRDKEKYWSKYLARLNFIVSEQDKCQYAESIKVLDKLEEEYSYFSQSQYIIIESQMAISYENTRMGQHLISYFLTRFKDKGKRPLIIEINSKIKTKLLGCPEKLSKYQYKKWCREKALELLKTKSLDDDNKNKFIKLININKKSDDMGDVVCYFEAWTKIIEDGLNQVPMPSSN